MTDENYRGAYVLFTYEDEDDNKWYRGYISFSPYEYENEVDSFGVPDENIFFYSTLEEVLGILTKKNNGSDFRVKEIVLVRADDVG